MPPDKTYSAGDYLAMWGFFLPIFSLFAYTPHLSLPVNPERDAKRVLSRFKLLSEEVFVDTVVSFHH